MIYLKQIRVKHWIKNFLIFAPLIFSLKLLDFENLLHVFIAFLSFSFLASFIYVINDIADLEADKAHPIKSKRPIASGKIKLSYAYLLAICCLAISVTLSITINIYNFYTILAAYFFLNIAYAYLLKHISIIDCITIAIGFELRILAGCFVINVIPSNFILIVTFFLALFLSFIKRKGELKTLKEKHNTHRKVLSYYTLNLLEKYIFSTATLTLIGYIFYTMDKDTIKIFGNDYLKYSTIIVTYGILRFIQLSEIEIYNNEGDPTTLIYKDKSLQLTLLVWIIYIITCIYVAN